MSESQVNDGLKVGCSCGYVERCAHNPKLPIVFDERMDLYGFQYLHNGGPAFLVIYFCPSCGGAAPTAHRSNPFHDLDDALCEELCKNTSSCSTLAEVVTALGPPDEDGPTTIRYASTDSSAPRVDRVRRITYHSLYETMSVSFEQRVGEAMARSFVPKLRQRAN